MNVNVPVESLHVEVNGLRMHAVVAGEGWPLVLVHGLGTSAMCWEHNVEPLSRCGRVYAVDMPGFGESAPPPEPLSAEALAESLIAWCEAAGITQAAFLGHSLGGEVCMWIAAKRPDLVSGLILAGSTGARSQLGLTRRFGRLMADGIREPIHFLPTLLKAYYRAGPRRIYRTAMSSEPDRLAGHLPSIQAPTLVLWGRNDPVVPLREARQLSRAMPNARLSVIADGAHGLIFDAPEEFNTTVCRFLEETHGRQAKKSARPVGQALPEN
jgi:pimeloyl-ACP methyl ester carboxylesterase